MSLSCCLMPCQQRWPQSYSKHGFIFFLTALWLICAPTTSPPIYGVLGQSVGNSFITLEVGLDVCPSPSKVFMDDIGDMYLFCSNGIIQKSGDMVYLVHNSTNCSPQGAFAKDPVSGIIYASCGSEGIFQIDGVTTTTIVNASVCETALSFAEGTISKGFLLAACDPISNRVAALIRINITNFQVEVLRDSSQCPSIVAGLTYYSDPIDGNDYVVGGCIYPSLFRMNLMNGSVQLIDSTLSPCSGASGIARDSDTGILWISCYLTGGVVRVNGTTVTTVVALDGCLSPTHIRNDPMTNIKYVACASGTIAISNGIASPFVKLSQCRNPYSTLGVDGAVLVTCVNPGVIRVPSITVSLAVTDSACSIAQAVVVNRDTGAIISSCQEGIVLTVNNVDTVLVNGTDCVAENFSGLTLKNGFLYARCAGNMLLMFETATYRLLRRIDTYVMCGNMESYYPNPRNNTIYMHCDPSGLLAYNTTSGLYQKLLPYARYGPCFAFEKDAFSDSLYLAHRQNGLVRYDLGSGNATTLINSTQCPNVYNVVVGDKGIVYANCNFLQEPHHMSVFLINGSSITLFAVNDQCQTSPNVLAYNPPTNTLLVSCAPDAGVFTFDTVTNVWTSVVSIEQCPFPAVPFQDFTTLSVYVPCGQLAVVVSSQDFKCQPGSMWSYGTCIACPPQTHRSYANLEPFGKCIPCSPGYVAASVGSSSCTPCQPGTYEYNGSCYLCSPGRYQASNASTSCVDCSPGLYAIHPGNTACTQCDAGFYAATNGTVSCSPCNSGSASNITGLDRPCDGCAAGTYQASIGQTSCFICPLHSYSEQSNSTSCTRCADRVNEARTTCTFVVCDSNSQFNVVTNGCDRCPLSQYSSRGGSCSTCNVNTYTPDSGSGCAPCENIDGLLCSGGVAQVQPGYWAFISKSPEASWTPLVDSRNVNTSVRIYQLYRTARCPFCPGTTLQLLPISNTSALGNGSSSANADGSDGTIIYCAFPRLNSVDNTLCGTCADGYLAWGESCVTCDDINGGLAFAYLVLSFALVLLLFYSATNPSSAGSMAILLFYIQTAALEMGPVVKFLDWIQVVVNLDPKSSGSCLAPWSPYEQTLFALLVPIILIGELMIVAVVHYCLYKFVFSDRSGKHPSQDVDVSISTSSSFSQQTSFSDKVCHFFIVRLSRFSFGDYYVGALSILLFCYTQVATASLRYLHCVDVNEQKLNFSAPTIDCNSTEYKHYLIPVILAIIVYIVGFPLLAGIRLWQNRQSLYSQQQQQQQSTLADGPPQAFLRHWSPFFLMYHPRAYFWQCGVLLRRAAFVVTAVLLIQQNSYRFMVFAFLHFASLLLHLYIRPYESDSLNRMETISYILLVSMSLLLTGISPPYPLGVQVLLFAIVVPPTIWMAGDIVVQRYQAWREISKAKSEMKKQKQQEKLVSAPIAADDDAGNGVSDQLPSPSLPPSDSRDVELQSVSTSIDAELNQHQMNESILPPYALSDNEQQL